MYKISHIFHFLPLVNRQKTNYNENNRKHTHKKDI